MKIFDFGWKANPFHRAGKTRAKLEADRREELEYRTKIAEIRRKASQMQRDTDRARSEAYRLEVSGDHAAALSKATEAVNSEKAYKAAVDTLLRCESMHAQAKTQKALTDLLTSCEEISIDVINQVDTEATMQAQVRLQQAEVAMEQLQQEMEAVQAGYEPGATPAICIAAGEEALTAIMAERTAPAREAEPALPAPAEAAPAGEPDISAIEERKNERRKLLAELA